MKNTDELKVYTGKEAVGMLLEGKVLEDVHQYKIEDDIILYRNGSEWVPSKLALQIFLRKSFTEVVTPQVGDWVRVTHRHYVHVAKVERLAEGCMWADWKYRGKQTFYRVDQEGVDWEVLTPEQVSEYKREQAFVKVGRKPNEFKADDIVFVGALGEVAVVISKENSGEFVKVHLINKTDGFKAKPHQLTPISFVEQQVDLS